MKAIACELPGQWGLPLSRFSRADLRRHVLATGLVAQISGVTICRWLRQDAIRPWSHRSWIFPRDPWFAEKAGPVLDLYHRRWQGKPLGPRDFVLSADEKTQIQLRQRRHPITAPGAHLCKHTQTPAVGEHPKSRTGGSLPFACSSLRWG